MLNITFTKAIQRPTLFFQWRPISVLTIDYKIVSSTIAVTLKNNLQNRTHTDQTGFMIEIYWQNCQKCD